MPFHYFIDPNKKNSDTFQMVLTSLLYALIFDCYYGAINGTRRTIFCFDPRKSTMPIVANAPKLQGGKSERREKRRQKRGEVEWKRAPSSSGERNRTFFRICHVSRTSGGAFRQQKTEK